MDCFEFCFNFAFNFNLRRYTEDTNTTYANILAGNFAIPPGEVSDEAAGFVGGLLTVDYQAGAYAAPLFSSTLAISDTQFTLNTYEYPLAPAKTPPKHPKHFLNTPKAFHRRIP
jgi:hypothetical protein